MRCRRRFSGGCASITSGETGCGSWCATGGCFLASLPAHGEEEEEEVGRLRQSLEMEIVRVLEATNRLHESAEWELAGLVEKQPEMLDGVVARQTAAIKEEIGKLESEAERLAREIGELTGKTGPGVETVK